MPVYIDSFELNLRTFKYKRNLQFLENKYARLLRLIIRVLVEY